MFIAIIVRRRSVAHLCFCNSPIDDQSPSIPNCLGVTPIGLSLRFTKPLFMPIKSPIYLISWKFFLFIYFLFLYNITNFRNSLWRTRWWWIGFPIGLIAEMMASIFVLALADPSPSHWFLFSNYIYRFEKHRILFALCCVFLGAYCL